MYNLIRRERSRLPAATPLPVAWYGSKPPIPRTGGSGFADSPGLGGLAKPIVAKLPSEKLMPPGSETPIAWPGGAFGYGVPTKDAPPMKYPMVDPAEEYEPDLNKINARDDKYEHWTRGFHMMNIRNGGETLNGPEHSRPDGQKDFTASEATHIAMVNYMLKKENEVAPITHETGMNSRGVNGRLYPNQSVLYHGSEMKLKARSDMYPDGTRHRSHTHVSLDCIPNFPSNVDRAGAYQNATNANHGPAGFRQTVRWLI